MQQTIITPEKTWTVFFQELWEHKHILFLLGWRDILIHYKQTTVGILWVIVRPLLTAAIFTIVFSRVAGIESLLIPYPLLVLSGMLVWQFFSDTLNFGSQSFLANKDLVDKVYIPRLFLPASRIVCSLVDFSVLFLFYLALSIVRYGVMPKATLIFLPLFHVWLLLFSFFVSTLMAALIVRYRDFKHIIPFVLQFGLYVTTVGYSIDFVSFKLRYLLSCNPLVAIINGFRFCLFHEPLLWDVFFMGVVATIIIGICAIAYFKQSQDTFVDVL